jgi:hypothetical protein
MPPPDAVIDIDSHFFIFSFITSAGWFRHFDTLSSRRQLFITPLLLPHY